MKRTFIKTIFRDFKKNFTRLIAIVAIMALGVGFLIGLLSSTPDLQGSMDQYYDNSNLFDIQLKSTIGFSSSDMDSLKEAVYGIEEIEGFSAMDYKTIYKDKEISARTILGAFPSHVNQVEMLSGRFPKDSSECVVHNMGVFLDKNPIGEVIEVNEKSYTIVGICNTPVYYYRMQESTQIGNGILDMIVYINAEISSIPITDIVITIQGAKQYHSFKNDYFKFIEPYENQLVDLSISYIENRMNALYEEAYLEARKLLEENASIPSFMIDSILESQKEEIKKKVDEQFSETKWYVLNRKSNLSYISFNENSNKVDKVAVVFPFFFFFIAALIALTSISRLVQEDRASMGTLKSLGFSNLRILNKYFIYALFACIIGSLAGLFLGVYGIPMAIYFCYGSLFIMPQGVFSWHAGIVLLSTLSMSLTIFIVMIFVCLRALSEKPNALLVPKAPKAGKRIVLERIGFFWKRLKFKHKSSIRNIFRFKRNLIMMIVGIGGCTALMLVGLGLRDSLNAASVVQFEDIIQYDFSIQVQEKVQVDYFTDSKQLYLYKEEGSVQKNKEYAVQVLYTDDSILDYMNLEVEQLPEHGVLISSQLADVFHLRNQSKLTIDIGNRSKEFIVAGIFTCYIDNYIIMKSEVKDVNTMLIQLGPKDRLNYDALVQSIYDTKGFQAVTDLSSTKELYESLTNGIDLVILLIIFCSGLLAIIVIYNLTNININERVKEIATLKVLGYQRKEVLGYIYREILMMSVLGILFGFGLGPLLNLFVMKQISSPGQCFSVTIHAINFLYAFLITAVFVSIVLLFFIPKLKKIKMVESLKAVE